MALVVKNLPAMRGEVKMPVRSLDQEDPLEERMAAHSSFFFFFFFLIYKVLFCSHEAYIDVFVTYTCQS